MRVCHLTQGRPGKEGVVAIPPNPAAGSVSPFAREPPCISIGVRHAHANNRVPLRPVSRAVFPVSPAVPSVAVPAAFPCTFAFRAVARRPYESTELRHGDSMFRDGECSHVDHAAGGGAVRMADPARRQTNHQRCRAPALHRIRWKFAGRFLLGSRSACQQIPRRLLNPPSLRRCLSFSFAAVPPCRRLGLAIEAHRGSAARFSQPIRGRCSPIRVPSPEAPPARTQLRARTRGRAE